MQLLNDVHDFWRISMILFNFLLSRYSLGFDMISCIPLDLPDFEDVVDFVDLSKFRSVLLDFKCV